MRVGSAHTAVAFTRGLFLVAHEEAFAAEPLDRVRIVNKQSVAIHPRAHVGEGPVLGRVAGQAAEPELRAGFGGVERVEEEVRRRRR